MAPSGLQGAIFSRGVFSAVGQHGAPSCAPADSQQVPVRRSRCRSYITEFHSFNVCCSGFVSLKKCSTLASALGFYVFCQRLPAENFFFKKRLLTIRTLNCCLITAAWLFFLCTLKWCFSFSAASSYFQKDFFFLIFASQSRPRQFCPFIWLSFSQSHIQICAIFVFQDSLALTSGLFLTFSHQQPQPSQLLVWTIWQLQCDVWARIFLWLSLWDQPAETALCGGMWHQNSQSHPCIKLVFASTENYFLL